MLSPDFNKCTMVTQEDVFGTNTHMKTDETEMLYVHMKRQIHKDSNIYMKRYMFRHSVLVHPGC